MKLLMGLEQKMIYDFVFIIHYEGLYGFHTNHMTKAKYLEFTPYSKGNLFKLRYYPEGYFKVFFGTKEITYCTTLKDCLPFIQPK